ncbi:MAG: single-stranded DNA-binding protein [Drouetiella hepatica Uher 2000/2452]|jgi:single-stranded DNA-binding protein|uniref:Single-stranded DNA-binding protein n=1 Tax=Drouetiella hepatica Uher 2000/2452 TaxID=904376 RepID=A0A951Q9C0_9CYAN|nr:single-stranded DNA-binding protein [Drouetiella hepatica Uher 2000/2452]
MNNCILMAEVIQDPQLRYTPDNQTPIAEIVVQFPGIRDEDPPSTLKVVGWGNLAQEIQEKYHVGDRVIVEGRLNMNRIDRPEGFKETRAELTAQRIHLIGADSSLTTSAVTPASTSASSPAPTGTTFTPSAAPTSVAKTKPAAKPMGAPASEPAKSPAYSGSKPSADQVDYDDIPF